MGPSIRLMGYRDPWWDSSGRIARRRRRRRLIAFGAVVVLGASLGFAAAETRAAQPQMGTWSSVTSSAVDATR